MSYDNLIPIDSPIMRTSLSPLPGSEQLSPDQLAQFVRPGYPQVRHSPFPPVAQSAAGAQVHSIAQTLAAKSVSAIPALNNKNQIDVSKSNGAAFVNKTQDYVDDGTTYARVVQTALTSNQIDPSKVGVLAKGSTPSNLSTGFTYTSTTSSITINWSGLTIYRADGTTTAVTDSGFTVSGLTSNSTFKFFPYWDEALSAVNFVGPGSGGPTGSGSPAIAFASGSNLVTQNQNLQNRIPLAASTGFTAATTASGSGGGSGGGSGSCLHEAMMVETQRGIIQVIDAEIGDQLLDKEGWQTVTHKRVSPAEIWVHVELTDESEIIVSPTHPFTMPEGSDSSVERAQDLSLADFLDTRKGVGCVKRIEVLEMKARKVSLTVEPSHSFFAGKNSPAIRAHNYLPS